MNDDFLDKKLNERKEADSLRRLPLPRHDMIDFCSNDYLGIAKNKLLNVSPIHNAHGSTGSRLLTGNYPLIEDAENFIAQFHKVEAALIFNSGYDANIGLLSCIPQRGDTILYDYLSHASIRDGIRLSFAQAFSFAHNDLNDLESKLTKATRNIFVVTESVFSMDGDIAPLEELVTLCERFNAKLIIDEAHATGVIGDRGEGLVQTLSLESKVFARVHTFGKALGTHGATVVGSDRLKSYLINFARSFIYSTALPESTVSAILDAYQLFPALAQERKHLQSLVNHLHASPDSAHFASGATPIQSIIVPGNEAVKLIATNLQSANLDVRPILYPTVPKGSERLRVVFHSFNTIHELDLLLAMLKNSC